MCNDWWENFLLPFLWIIDFPLFPMLFAVPLELNMFAVFGFESYVRSQKSTLQGAYISFWLYICLCVCPGGSLKPGHGLISGREVGRSNWTQYSAQAMNSLWMSAVTADGNNTTVIIWKTLWGVMQSLYRVSSYYIDTHTYKHLYTWISDLICLLIIFCAGYLIKLVSPSKQFSSLCIAP